MIVKHMLVIHNVIKILAEGKLDKINCGFVIFVEFKEELEEAEDDIG